MKSINKPDLAKVNVTITLGPKLTEAGKAYAKDLEMSFSELIALLVRKELASPTLSFRPVSPSTDSQP